MIQYSERARVGYARLFRPYNDIDVFVEDSSYLGLYETIINRALRGRAKVTRVTPLGPRDVVEAAAIRDASNDIRQRLYIVDGDLDTIAMSKQKQIKNLYRLKVYSIENVVAEPISMEQYCRFASPNLLENVYLAKVNIPQLMQELDRLRAYIVMLATARRLDLRGSMFSINPPSVMRTTSSGLMVGIDAGKVQARCKAIRDSIVRAKGMNDYYKAKRAVLKNIAKKKLSGAMVSPGKNFVLSILNNRVVDAGGQAIKQRVMVSYLGQNIRFINEPGLAARLRKVAR